MKCFEKKYGNVVFIDVYIFDDIIRENFYSKDDFVFLCFDGKIVEYIGVDFYKKCNFGCVFFYVFVICNMYDGIWWWKVIKVLFEV